MVPASVPPTSRTDHAAARRRGRTLGLLLGALGVVGNAGAQVPVGGSDGTDAASGTDAISTTDATITGIVWQRAFLFGSQARGTGETGKLEARGSQPIELYLVLEGEREGLPVYCATYANFRVDGRAIPQRMILLPRDVGLGRAGIHWAHLKASPDGRTWRRVLIPGGKSRWSIPIDRFDETDTDDSAIAYGTTRIVAAIDVQQDGSRVLETPGWNTRGTASEPPGYFVSRVPNGSLSGLARAYVGVPIDAGATDAQRRVRAAMRPIDLVLGPYEDLGSGPLPGPRDRPLDAQEWSWLVEIVTNPVFVRAAPDAPFVSDRGRGLHWSAHASPGEAAIEPGDVLLAEGFYALLENDDGDGWLDSGDSALLADGASVRRGALDALPVRRLRILRPRDFTTVRSRLASLGYGAERLSSFFDPALGRSILAFQADQGLPRTGLPDDATLEALDELLTRLDAPDAEGSATPR